MDGDHMHLADPDYIARELRTLAVPIASLQTHPENPRIGDVGSIVESLKRFGQVRPIVVQASTGYIVAGNHTTKAARELGWDRIAAARIDLSDEDALAYLLADNRLADRGRYDNEVLAELLQRASGNLAGTGYSEDDALAMMDDMPVVRPPEEALVADLRPHPENYRQHPPEQIEHLKRSLRGHGAYRSVVVANDGVTVLAGHGLLVAASELGMPKLLVTRMDYAPDDPEALKLVAGDNEIGKLAARDDRRLTEMLKTVQEVAGDLLGSGFDPQTLANLVFVSRPEGEIADFDAAAEWVGMPDFQPQGDRIKLILAFDDEAGRDQLIDQLGLIIAKKTRQTWSAWWPPRELEDLSSLRFVRDDVPDADGEGSPEAAAEGSVGTSPVVPPTAEQDAANAEAEAVLRAAAAKAEDALATPDVVGALDAARDRLKADPAVGHVDVIAQPYDNSLWFTHHGCDTPSGKRSWVVPLDDVTLPEVGSTTECAECAAIVPIRNVATIPGEYDPAAPGSRRPPVVPPEQGVQPQPPEALKESVAAPLDAQDPAEVAAMNDAHLFDVGEPDLDVPPAA